MENTEPASHQGQSKRLRGHPRLRGEVVYGAHSPPRREPAELIELARRSSWGMDSKFGSLSVAFFERLRGFEFFLSSFPNVGRDDTLPVEGRAQTPCYLGKPVRAGRNATAKTVQR
jgi:hypothetical protein